MRPLYYFRHLHFRVLLVLLLLTSGVARAQAPAWQTAVTVGQVESGGLSPNSYLVLATAADENGNVYLTGNFLGTVSFGSITLTTTTSTGEAYVAKWSSTTNSFVWAQRGSSTGMGNITASAIAVNGTSIYVGGQYSGTTTVFGSPSRTSSSNSLYVVRLNDLGTSASYSWFRQSTGTGGGLPTALAVSGTSVYVLAEFSGTVSFGATTLTSVAGSSSYNGSTSFVAKLADNSNGSIRWAQQLNGAPGKLAAYGTSVYVAGVFDGATIKFGSTTLPNANAADRDIFVTRLTDAGFSASFTGAQRAGGTGRDRIFGLAAGAAGAYLCGDFSGAVTFGTRSLSESTTGKFNGYLARWNPASQDFDWAQRSDYSTLDIAVSGTNVYLTGDFNMTTAFGGTSLTSAGDYDAYVAKLTDTGTAGLLNWAQRAGGTGSDYATTLAVGGTRVFVLGNFESATAAFGSLSLTNPNPNNSAAPAGFLASLNDLTPVLTLVAPGNGAIGSTVTLYGQNLTGTTSIAFAGTSNNVVTTGYTVNAAGTQITGVLVPAGAQSGQVTVTSARGTDNRARFAVTLPNPAPAWQLAQVASQANGSNNSSSVRNMATDASGNVYLVGFFQGSVTFGTTTLTSAGGSDTFVTKWSPATSSFVWVQQVSGPGTESGEGIAVSGSNIYIYGNLSGPASFGGLSLTGTGDGGFVAKLTDAGSSSSFTWVQPISGLLIPYQVAVSGTSVYVIGGAFQQSITFGSVNMTADNNGDGFVAKLTDAGSSGSFVWAQHVGGPDTDEIQAVAVNGTSVYVAGYFGSGAATNVPVMFGTTTLTSAGDADIFVAKLTDTGSGSNFVWAQRAGGALFDEARVLAVNGANVYVGGEFVSSPADFGTSTQASAGDYDAFVCKLTDAGTTSRFDWARQAGGTGPEYATALTTSGSNVYLTGTFSTTASFGPTTSLTSAGNTDVFVTKLTDAGTSGSKFSWAQQAGGSGFDYSSGLAVVGSIVYVGGSIAPPASFGPRAILTPTSTRVAFLASLTDAAQPTATVSALAGAGLRLYPNPAHGTVTVQLPGGLLKTEVLLTDVLGREVRRYPAPGAAEATLDLRGLPAGLYVLRGAGHSQRLVVE